MLEVAAIVPILKGEDFLPQCLDSLLNQTYPLAKIIIVLDTNIISNRFYEVYSQYRDNPKIEFWQSKETYGPTKIQNRVMQSRQFKYFLIQDADDWSARNRLELLIKNISDKSEMTASGEIYFHSREARTRAGRHSKIWEERAYKSDPLEALITNPNHLMVAHWHTCLVAKSLFDRVGGMSGITYVGGGLEFISRCVFATRIIILPNYLYFYRQLSDSFLHDRILGGKSKESRELYKKIRTRTRQNIKAIDLNHPLNLTPLIPCVPRVQLYKWE